MKSTAITSPHANGPSPKKDISENTTIPARLPVMSRR